MSAYTLLYKQGMRSQPCCIWGATCIGMLHHLGQLLRSRAPLPPVHGRLKEVKTLRRRPEGQGAGAAGRLFVRALAFDATGSYLAAASDDKSQGMLLWDAATWDQLLAL